MKNASVLLNSKKPFLQVLGGKRLSSPPIWLMRQAGRYLPEYREIRSKSANFMDFCFSPKMACEATIQPIRRFGFDAAIIFSDILVIPEALGQTVSFEAGEGPRLEPISEPGELKQLKEVVDLSILEPVFETIDRVKSLLPGTTALIGFCGAPWTVATYMIAGHGTPDQRPARLFAYKNIEYFQKLIDLLVDSSIAYLSRQIEAGVEAVQIFDSWAGVLPACEFNRWCLKPTIKIAEAIRAKYPDVGIIAFPRAVGSLADSYVACDAINGVGLDTAADLKWAAKTLQSRVAVQGNLDPLALLSGGQSMQRQTEEILQQLRNGPHIFNLGHGILPETPISHVEELIRIVRHWETVA